MSNVETTLARHAALLENLEKQVEKNSEMVETVYKISASIDNLTKTLEKFIETADKRASNQGERIGALESSVESLLKFDDTVKDHDSRIKYLETKGSKKWENFVSMAMGAVVTGIIIYVLARFGMSG